MSKTLMDITEDGLIEVNMTEIMILSRDYRNLLRVARAADILIRHGNSPKWKHGLIPWREIAEGPSQDDLIALAEALKAVEHLL